MADIVLHSGPQVLRLFLQSTFLWQTICRRSCLRCLSSATCISLRLDNRCGPLKKQRIDAVATPCCDTVHIPLSNRDCNSEVLLFIRFRDAVTVSRGVQQGCTAESRAGARKGILPFLRAWLPVPNAIHCERHYLPGATQSLTWVMHASAGGQTSIENQS